MSTIIQFPSPPDPKWRRIEERIDKELSNVIPEVRKTIKDEVINSLKEYSKFDKEFSLNLPDTITSEQIEALKSAFNDRNTAIQEILRDLISTKIELCIEKYKNS